jgi:hypothetical protein
MISALSKLKAYSRITKENRESFNNKSCRLNGEVSRKTGKQGHSNNTPKYGSILNALLNFAETS